MEGSVPLPTDDQLAKQPVPGEVQETIPVGLKTYFFSDRRPPNLLNDFDCVGFSSENTLVKYNVGEVSKLLVSCFLKELHASFPEFYP